jgi:hypothetical protein
MNRVYFDYVHFDRVYNDVYIMNIYIIIGHHKIINDHRHNKQKSINNNLIIKKLRLFF